MDDAALLQISTLGGLSILLDDEPVAGLASRKVEALLVYLACTGRAHPREALAEMLWAERAQAQSMSNLRVALSSLRKHVKPYVIITRETAAISAEAAVWLDVAEMERKLDAGESEQAVALYQGDFLEGFYVRGCPSFEDWAAVERERLHHTVLDVLKGLVAACIAQARYQDGLSYASRMLQMDPLTESAHRHMMLLLAQSGQRAAAMAQFETCRRVLADELGVGPDAETLSLFQQIQAGELEAPAAAPVTPTEVEIKAQLPTFLETECVEAPQPVFVARERELRRLGEFLNRALAGFGALGFVTGGPGTGKTALMAEFARRAMRAHRDVLVAGGHCNAYSGMGDPYLPFREIMAALTGDIEPLWQAGAISRDHARRLWDVMPDAVQALLDHGPHVVPALIPGEPLLSRCSVAASKDAPWLEQLAKRVARQPTSLTGLEQSHLFQQVTNILRELSQRHPLLLILDDLQWADAASISLLFHLGSRLDGSHTMILCAYRPEEVNLGSDRSLRSERLRHPLEKTLNEFRRRLGDVWLDLGQIEPSENQRFVDAILDTEANRLSEDFRRALHQRTEGHALFTIELLRAMQERSDLIQDEAGNWIEGPALDWESLPPKVEGVINERMGRLEGQLRDMLSVASVEGETFTAQVVACVQQMDERQVLQALSQRLEKRHRLVREQDTLREAGQRRSRYRFSHLLFQQYLYHDLGKGERELLHGEVARALEMLYASPDSSAEVAVQLARHYAESGDTQRALKYFRQAGDLALAAYANREAERHYRKALELAPCDAERAHLLSGLGQAQNRQNLFQDALRTWREGIQLFQKLEDSDNVALLYALSTSVAGSAGDQRESLRLCREGLEACSGAPESPGFARLLHDAARSYIHSAALEQARPLCQRAIEMAQRLGFVEAQADALATLGAFLLSGEEAIGALTQAATLAERHQLLRVAARTYNNLGVVFADGLGDFKAARDEYRRATAVGRQMGGTPGQLLSVSNLVEVAAILGDFADARASLAHMKQLASQTAESSGRPVITKSEMLLLAFQGEWKDVARLARAAGSSAHERGAPIETGTANRRLAWVLLDSFCLDRDGMPGELGEAEAPLSDAIRIYDGSGHFGFAVEARVMLGNLCLLQGRLDETRSLLDEAQNQARLHPFIWNQPRLLALRAQLAAAEERWSAALEFFEAAAGHYARMEARWYWARTLLDWAETHVARGAPGDVERARALLCDAQAAFEDMGIKRYAGFALQRLKALRRSAT